MNIFLRDEPMHLRLKKGMLILIRSNKNLVPALVISDVYVIKEMFHMVDIIIQGKKKRARTTWIREIYL